MVERRARSQISNLTPDHKKSGIDPILVCAGGVRHTVGKLLRRATSLLQTSSQSEVLVRSYEFPKSRESKPGQFWDSSLGVPRNKSHLDAGAAEQCRILYGGRWWLPPSSGPGESSESVLPMACP